MGIKHKLCACLLAGNVYRITNRCWAHRKHWFRCKFLLSEHILAHLAQAIAWTKRRKIFWRKFWSGSESSCITFESHIEPRCERRPLEALALLNVTNEVQHGGSDIEGLIHVSSCGVGRLQWAKERMNVHQYISIPFKYTVRLVTDKDKKPSIVIYTQNNDPKYTSRCPGQQVWDHNDPVLSCQAFPLSKSNFKNFCYLFRSILLKQEVKPHHLGELWVVLLEECAKTPLSFVENLSTSISIQIMTKTYIWKE